MQLAKAIEIADKGTQDLVSQPREQVPVHFNHSVTHSQPSKFGTTDTQGATPITKKHVCLGMAVVDLTGPSVPV